VQLRPDVAILDLSMPRLDGLGAARQLTVRVPATQLILMTGHVADHNIVLAFAAGIRGFVAKGDAADDLVRAIETVRHRKTFLSASACRVILDRSLKAEAHSG
jgi:DNA-binding NarL/FixJ family response regulator